MNLIRFLRLYTFPFLFVVLTCVAYVIFLFYKYKTDYFYEALDSWIPVKTSLESKKVKTQKISTYEVLARILNVREKPSVDSRIVSRIYRGDKVSIREVENSWGKNDQGYIFLDPQNIKKIESEQKPTISSALEQQVIQNDQVHAENNKFSAKKIDLASQEVEELIYRVVPSIINVRSKPDFKSKIKARLYRGDEVKITQIVGKWGKTEQGFIALELLERVR